MISWLFKEWLAIFEASSDPDIRRNFEDYYTMAIKPFLIELDRHSDANPTFMSAEQKAKLNAYLTNMDILYDDLKKITTAFFSTLFNSTTYSNWNIDRQHNKIAKFLKDEDFKFKKYNTFNEYLVAAGYEKGRFGQHGEASLQDLASLIKYFFVSTAVSTNAKASLKTVGGETEGGGQLGIDDLSMGSKVTTGRESQGQGWVIAGQVNECLRKLYHLIALKNKKEMGDFLNNISDNIMNSEFIKNLANIKKKIHLTNIAKYISGQKSTSDPNAIPEDNISDQDFSNAANPSYTDAKKDYERNYLKTSLLQPEKMSEFFEQDKLENPATYDTIKTVTSILYYIGILKNMQKDKAKSFGPEQKKAVRKEFISLLPNDLTPLLTDDYLKEFSSMSPSQLPTVTYPATLDDMKSRIEGKKFDGFIKDMFLSTEFPSSYRVNKRDARGELSETREKEDIIAKLLQPIFDTLISRTAVQFKPEDQDNVFDFDFKFDCQKYLKQYKDEGLI